MAKRSTPNPASAVVYTRVSTQRQVTDGVSLDQQLARCESHAAHQGLPIVARFTDEGLSGKDDERPGLKALLAYCKDHPDTIVIVYSISRLSRRQKHLWNMIDDRDGLGLRVASATEPFDTSTPIGRAMLGMLAVWSQLEADMISERTRDAMAHLQAQGVKVGRPALATRASDAVAEIKRLYATGKFTHRSLADHLNATNVPTASGGKWWPKTVRTALLSQ